VLSTESLHLEMWMLTIFYCEIVFNILFGDWLLAVILCFVLQWFIQIAMAVHYIHSQKILHRFVHAN